ncbi:hypothetical protein UG54_00125 [Gordonia sihwensis]|nr:hypothetical protein UG54_00125 [Gordonia sihwensis]
MGSGGRGKSHTSLERSLRERLPHKLAMPVRDAIRAASHAVPHEMTVVDFTASTKLAFAGIFGPDNQVHGMSVWIGDTTDEPGPPPAAAGITWNSLRRLIHLPVTLPRELRGPHVPNRSTLTPPEFFRAFEVEDSIAFIRTLLSPDPGAEYDCIARYQRAGESISAIHLALTGTNDHGELWKGIVHEVLPPEGSFPSLESATLAALPMLSPEDTHIVLVDIAKMRLLRWVTDPIREVQWKGQVDNRDTPHPDDVERIFAAVMPILTGEARSAQVNGIRLRRLNGAVDGRRWLVIDGDGTVLPEINGVAPALGLVRFRVVGYSTDPDDVPVDDDGHPGI